MLQEQLFFNQWGVWICFVGEPNESNEKYYENFQLLFTIRSPAEFAYTWTHYGLNNLENFLVMANNKQKTYLVNDKWRKINSVEYFKKGIQPKWQDPKNQKGGRFLLSVNRTQKNKDQIYSNLVFYLLGEDFNHSQHINGFRFISPKNNQAFYRIEIWVDFSEEDTQIIKDFQHVLIDLFKNLNLDLQEVPFLKNKTKPKEVTKQEN